MSSRILKAYSIMIFPGILLLPAVVPHAVQDLQDLKTIIDSASAAINAAPNSSSWGFLNPVSPSGTLGTADLISNITTTVLRATYLLNVDKTAWTTLPQNTTSPTNTTSSTAEPPTAKPSSDAPPSPNTTTPPSNLTLDQPYIDYVTSVPTLANALTTLGRSWHKEMNKPVWESIDALQQTISAFSSALLQADLIHSQSVIRTIRASSSLEDAQIAWSRLLNIPGAGAAKSPLRKREEDASRAGVMRFPPWNGVAYTHRELWGGGQRRAKLWIA